jgi:hypothetical protein
LALEPCTSKTVENVLSLSEDNMAQPRKLSSKSSPVVQRRATSFTLTRSRNEPSAKVRRAG